jgi:hypothetical protein
MPRLVTAYFEQKPDRSIVSEKVSFGTSGHRGSAFERSFNEGHILAISQAVCLYRSTYPKVAVIRLSLPPIKTDYMLICFPGNEDANSDNGNFKYHVLCIGKVMATSLSHRIESE